MITGLRGMLPSVDRVTDLIAFAAICAVIQPILPVGNPLADPELLPWMTAVLVVAAALRGGSLGAPPHPSLHPRPATGWRWWAERAAVAGAPVVLLGYYEAARALLGALGGPAGQATRAAWLLAYSATASVALYAAARAGREHERTAWRPFGLGSWAVLAGRVVATVGVALALGSWHGLVGDHPARWLAKAALLGLQFHSVGLIADRLQVRDQRRAAGRRDGNPWRPPRFRYLLAAFGPSIGLLALVTLHAVMGWGTLAFDQGAVIAVHVLAWVAVLWPGRTPVAVSCVLHEVVPGGGLDPDPTDLAQPFERPPVGALRLNPLDVQRLLVLHHWTVPVIDPRLEGIDDPIRPLWAAPPVSTDWHVLGSASFEPDAQQRPQWERITIRLRDQRDVARLGDGSAQTRRLVVLRAFPPPGVGLFRRATRTYLWERSLPEGVLQVVDATTEALEVRNGDVIVLSNEGVARAFEVEIGAPVYALSELGLNRTPQLEDYVGIG